MDKLTQTSVNNLRSEDRELQNEAFFHMLKITDKPIDWAYEAWDDIVANLTHKDNHNRAIAAQILCGLAKSDPKERILKDFDKLLAVTKDEKFVTARHCMQALWKIGVVGKKQQKLLMDGLKARFKECISEKNCTLIRYDILESMRNVYDVTRDENIKVTALELIKTETDLKYQKKYTALWKFK